MRCLKILIFAALFFAAAALPAPTLQAQVGNYVQEVRVEGASRVPEATIRAQLKTKPGLIVDRQDINEDIHRLFQLGHFKDIQVDEERGAHGWIYTFLVTEKPVLSKIAIEGNKKIKDNTLRELITIPLYQPLNEQKAAESVAAIQEAYAKKRYYLVDVETHLRTAQTGDHEFVFTIKEHERAFVRYVHFIGNSVFSDDELRRKIKIKRKSAFGFLTGAGKYEEEALKQDVLRLTFHYLKNGYLKVKVDLPQVTLTKDKRYIFVSFKIQEGDKYRIGKIDVQGDILTTREELLDRLLTKPGDVYNREYVERDIQAMTQKYADQGYAFVVIHPLTTANDTDKTADIVFNITKGSPIVVEKINVLGNTTTRDKVVRRELKIKEGDLYNETKIQESKEKLMALGFFKDVNFATPRGTKDDTLNLDVTVEERPTGSFSLGAGFSTVENFVLTGSLQKQNFFGRGWNGELSAEFSSRRQQFLFSMIDPYFLDSEWILGTSAFRTIYRFEDFNRESVGGSMSIGHRFFDNASMNLAYEAEQVDAVAFATNVPDRWRGNASGLTSLIGLTLNRDTRDNRIYPNKGLFNSAQMEVSHAELGADNSFYRMTGKTQYYLPVYKGLIFKTFARIGYIRSLDPHSVPLFERYFLGGINSLRGYFPSSIGPADTIPNTDNSFVFGGNKMIVLNGELEYPIYEPAGLRLVTFFDSGNSFAEDDSFALNRLRSNWGYGLRWISPMGPLRFEWGFPINKKPRERGTVFNFTIGSFF